MRQLVIAIFVLMSLMIGTSAQAAQFFCKWSAYKVDGQNFSPWSDGEMLNVSVEPSSLSLNGIVYTNPVVVKLPNGNIRTTYFAEKNGIKFLASFAIDPSGGKILAIYNDRSKDTLAGNCVNK